MATAADAANATLAREYDADEEADDAAGQTKPLGMRTVSTMWTTPFVASRSVVVMFEALPSKVRVVSDDENVYLVASVSREVISCLSVRSPTTTVEPTT